MKHLINTICTVAEATHLQAFFHLRSMSKFIPMHNRTLFQASKIIQHLTIIIVKGTICIRSKKINDLHATTSSPFVFSTQTYKNQIILSLLIIEPSRGLNEEQYPSANKPLWQPDKLEKVLNRYCCPKTPVVLYHMTTRAYNTAEAKQIVQNNCKIPLYIASFCTYAPHI